MSDENMSKPSSISKNSAADDEDDINKNELDNSANNDIKHIIALVDNEVEISNQNKQQQDLDILTQSQINIDSNNKNINLYNTKHNFKKYMLTFKDCLDQNNTICSNQESNINQQDSFDIKLDELKDTDLVESQNKIVESQDLNQNLAKSNDDISSSQSLKSSPIQIAQKSSTEIAESYASSSTNSTTSTGITIIDKNSFKLDQDINTTEDNDYDANEQSESSINISGDDGDDELDESIGIDENLNLIKVSTVDINKTPVPPLDETNNLSDSSTIIMDRFEPKKVYEDSLAKHLELDTNSDTAIKPIRDELHRPNENGN